MKNDKVMRPPDNCPYRGLTAPPCWHCPHHVADIDHCRLSGLVISANNATAFRAPNYDERMRAYEQRRQELLQLSKEALVDLIIQPPTYYY